MSNTGGKIILRRGIGESILLFVTGFLAISSFSTVIMDAVGYNLIELLFIPILWHYIKKRQLKLDGYLKITVGELLLAGWLVFSIILAIFNTADAFAVITCIRPFIYMLLIFKYLKINKTQLNLSHLYILAIGCVLGEFVYIQNFSVFFTERGYHHINIIAIALITIIPVIQKRYVWAMVSFVLGFAVSVTSGYRINILVSIVALTSSVIVIFLISSNIKEKMLFLLVSICLILVLLWSVNNFSQVSQFLTKTLNLSDAVVTRSLDRIENLLEGELTQGDENRMKHLVKPFREFGNHLAPRGPVGKTDLQRFGYYTDSPMIFFYDVFGAIGAWIFALACAIKFIGQGIKIGMNWKLASDYNRLFLVMLPVWVCLIVLNGTFLTFVHISILFAFAAGGGMLIKKEQTETP